MVKIPVKLILISKPRETHSFFQKSYYVTEIRIFLFLPHELSSTLDANNFEKSVSILMATFQGEKFIAEQLESIALQSHTNWKVIVSDDGSTDATFDYLQQYQSKWPKGKIELQHGPKAGFCRNFLSIACDPELSADYYAFSDQDDIWNEDKLARAIAFLDTVEEDTPALYCGRTLAIDEIGNPLWLSPHFKRPPSFKNAIMQNIGGGNTMVFNEAARKLLQAAGPNIDVPSHDWWLYILVTGCGGRVNYDPVSSVLYRQHSNNLVGSNSHFRGRFNRLMRLLRGQAAEWNEVHIKSLRKVNWLMTTESKKVLENLRTGRSSNIIFRIYFFFKSGIVRQTKFGQIALIIAMLLGKI